MTNNFHCIINPKLTYNTIAFEALLRWNHPEQGFISPATFIPLAESLLIEDSDRLVHALAVLRSEGVHFSIDDFGTGYSNLGYLKKFEVGALEIDQSLVRKMDGQTGDAAIVRAIIQMASSLGLKTIAEGVEDFIAAALLRGLGCNEAQGYYWARPMPANEVENFCKNWPQSPI